MIQRKKTECNYKVLFKSSRGSVMTSPFNICNHAKKRDRNKTIQNTIEMLIEERGSCEGRREYGALKSSLLKLGLSSHLLHAFMICVWVKYRP